MTALQRRMIARLREVRAGSTMRPGRLARDCGTTLAEARPDLVALAEAKTVVLSQQGRPVVAAGLKGPFRVRLPLALQRFQ